MYHIIHYYFIFMLCPQLASARYIDTWIKFIIIVIISQTYKRPPGFLNFASHIYCKFDIPWVDISIKRARSPATRLPRWLIVLHFNSIKRSASRITGQWFDTLVDIPEWLSLVGIHRQRTVCRPLLYDQSFYCSQPQRNPSPSGRESKGTSNKKKLVSSGLVVRDVSAAHRPL